MKVTSQQRESLIEKYRYINTEWDNWWDCTESDFMADMKKVGVHVHSVHFSGFYSQGDGACFTGYMANIQTYLDHHHVDQFPMLRKLLEHGGEVSVQSKHTGRYYHENSVTIGVEADKLYHVVESRSELQDAVIEQWDVLLDAEICDFETVVTEQWRTYMQELYRKLEAEYEYLTSDEAVWETLEANELIEETEDC